ncbi:MAG: uroporphyrinogen-III C-methyltransferase [Dehalococcoidia bacterium]|nr:uroporphyrinogen-III C-methyltransferase [Dehalococcoidia bacterium]
MAKNPPEAGLVSLVGAGPGDPGLITVKAMSRLQSADAVVYDRLSDPGLLAQARPDAGMFDAGKGPGDVRMTQEQINALLVELSSAGKSVCRLKGGDPFVFGRGGEEALALAAEGLPFEIIPGVTSSIAAAAYAGIPVTHRGVATSFTVITGSEDPSKPDSQLNWSALAALPGTLVFLMGWRALPEIANELISRGAPPDRPAALVQWGTTPKQRSVTGTLDNIAETGTAAGFGSPVAVIVGEVVGLRETIAWFDNKPLFGKRVLITRTRSQASRLRTELESAGAWCVEFPAISIVPVADPSALDAALNHISEYDWMTISSSNGARGLRARMDVLGLDGRAFADVKIAAVGPATGVRVREEMGITPDLVPDEYVSDAVLRDMKALGMDGKRVLVVGSDIGRDVLPDGLEALGATVDRVVGYETHRPENTGEQVAAAFADPGIDVTTFTSSSGVDNLVDLAGGPDPINGTITAAMGPITAERARERGLRVDIVAPERTMQSLAGAIVKHFENGDSDAR